MSLPNSTLVTRDRTELNWIVTVALFAPFLLVATLLAYTAQSERARRATESRVLRDYGVVATSAVVDELTTTLHAQLTLLLRPAMEAHAGEAEHLHRGVDPAAFLRAPAVDEPCVMLAYARGAFRLELPSGRIATAGDARLGGAGDLVASVRAEAGINGDPHRLLVHADGDQAMVVALQVFRDSLTQRATIYGVVTDTAALGAVVQRVLTERRVVPSELVRPPHGPDQIRVAVAARDGRALWENAAVDRSVAARDSLPSFLGKLVLHVEAGPAIATALSIGRPSSLYIPTLLALLVLSAALAVMAVVQLRRGRALARMRNRFVANVSHELKTPLAQISMFAEMLALGRDRNEAEHARYAQVIHREAQRLSSLVENVLGFARSQEGRTSVRLERRHVRSDLMDAVEAFAPLAHSAEARIDVDVPDELWVQADPGALRQVMLNVLDNAVKYGPRGQAIHVAASGDAGRVRIVVADEGPGIPWDQRDRVFAPYERVDRADGPRVAGTGIGLAVVAELVRAHGGEVRIAEASRGTVVEVMMPMAAP